MVQIIAEDIVILLLTIAAIFTSPLPSVFIIVTAVLLVVKTYDSLGEEHSQKLMWSAFGLMLIFAFLSNSFLGFLIFFFQRDIKISIRYLEAVGLFIVYEVLQKLVMPTPYSAGVLGEVFHASLPAKIIIGILALLLLFLLMEAFHRLHGWYEKKNAVDYQRLTMANISELHEKRMNEELVKQNLMAERNARLVERENISRNIHNSVGHSITAAIMTLDAADMLYEVKPEEARKKMNDANNRIRGSLEAIRRAVRVLDEENADLTVKDLKDQMSMAITEFMMDTSIQVHSSISDIADDITIPHDYVVFLTGALQEFLTNGAKHGKADDFFVLLQGDAAHVRLEVKDNGKSDFGKQNHSQRIQQGFGLKKIISYVEKCGGKTIFKNEDGFRSVVELPIHLSA